MAQEYAQLQQMLLANKQMLEQIRASNERLEQQMNKMHDHLFPPFRFLDLPRELRDRIYGFCVAPGKVFVRPRPEEDARLDDHDTYFKPEWQLLAISRQVRQEAAEILLGKNLIVLNNRDDEKDMICGWSDDWRPWEEMCWLAELSLNYLKSLSISFDFLSHGQLHRYGNVMHFPDSIGNPRNQNLNEDDLVLAAHAESHFHTEKWSDLIRCIVSGRFGRRDTHLKLLQVDVTNCYCPFGSCRMVEEVADALGYTSWPAIEVIEILGTKTQEERDTLRKGLELWVPSGSHYQYNPDENHRQPKLRFKAYKAPKDTRSRNLHSQGLEADLGDDEIDLQEIAEARLGEFKQNLRAQSSRDD